jgi:hypothetical protein
LLCRPFSAAFRLNSAMDHGLSNPAQARARRQRTRTGNGADDDIQPSAGREKPIDLCAQGRARDIGPDLLNVLRIVGANLVAVSCKGETMSVAGLGLISADGALALRLPTSAA